VILLDGRGTLDFDGYDGKYVVVVGSARHGRLVAAVGGEIDRIRNGGHGWGHFRGVRQSSRSAADWTAFVTAFGRQCKRARLR
jgi:hypothetical protein